VELKSPAPGQVVGLAFQKPGSVVQPGQKLMDIAPSNEPLLLEAKVQPNFIDRLQAGLPVDIRFNSFAHTPTLVVDGKVLSISHDLVTDPANPNIAYYLARVEVTPEGVKKLGARQLQAGMPTEVVFKTGERSLLNYLLGPLYKRAAAAMKEA
jgi:protease secretion system membrane fusion protein